MLSGAETAFAVTCTGVASSWTAFFVDFGRPRPRRLLMSVAVDKESDKGTGRIAAAVAGADSSPNPAEVLGSRSDWGGS